MDAEQLRDLARRVANRTGYRRILVLGSQAIHGSLPGRDLPELTTISEEADLAVVDDLTGDAPHEIEAHFGMGSPYHQHFGVYADGIALSEVTLPGGWKGRVLTEQVDDRQNPDNPVRLLFPEIHDLCTSKLTVAVTGGFGRRSDRAFVQALADAGHIDLGLLHERVDQLSEAVPDEVKQAARDIIDAMR